MAMLQTVNEGLKLKAQWQLIKWRDSNDHIAKLMQAGLPTNVALQIFKDHIIKVSQFEGNLGLNVGINALLELLAGISTPTKWDNTNARLGVGSDNTAASATQTDLLDATPTWKAMDASYPQRSNQTLEWRSTFGSGDANEAWNEFAVDNGAASHILLNRKVESKGTKVSGETWTLSLKITVS